ncbi:HNH endonuclease [Dyadobacter pollutisoli]|uniref:HNH endonuclease n=1 Tax=Dyadobacter pollutisoli TaxID=2910158 RepID=A0A9E8N9G4_9BACT|nr:HNH endonuclease [Dyadobacter pollutisoli]WAC12415.1 HNH endonuclease [Dyadobacter pollutisoli]
MNLHPYLDQLAHVRNRFGVAHDGGRDYLCPLCLQYFNIESKDLTIDHVPQQSLGGRKLVVTCRKCNNDAGWQIEPHLKGAMELFVNRDFPEHRAITVDLDVGEQKTLRGILTRTHLGVANFLLSEKNNDKRLVEKWNAKIDKGLTEFSAKPLSKTKILDTKVLVSLLKAAYLQVFWRFGYIPLYHSYFQPMRDQITNPSEIIYPLDLCYVLAP